VALDVKAIIIKIENMLYCMRHRNQAFFGMELNLMTENKPNSDMPYVENHSAFLIDTTHASNLDDKAGMQEACSADGAVTTMVGASSADGAVITLTCKTPGPQTLGDRKGTRKGIADVEESVGQQLKMTKFYGNNEGKSPSPFSSMSNQAPTGGAEADVMSPMMGANTTVPMGGATYQEYTKARETLDNAIEAHKAAAEAKAAAWAKVAEINATEKRNAAVVAAISMEKLEEVATAAVKAAKAAMPAAPVVLTAEAKAARKEAKAARKAAAAAAEAERKEEAERKAAAAVAAPKAKVDAPKANVDAPEAGQIVEVCVNNKHTFYFQQLNENEVLVPISFNGTIRFETHGLEWLKLKLGDDDIILCHRSILKGKCTVNVCEKKHVMLEYMRTIDGAKKVLALHAAAAAPVVAMPAVAAAATEASKTAAEQVEAAEQSARKLQLWAEMKLVHSDVVSMDTQRLEKMALKLEEYINIMTEALTLQDSGLNWFYEEVLLCLQWFQVQAVKKLGGEIDDVPEPEWIALLASPTQLPPSKVSQDASVEPVMVDGQSTVFSRQATPSQGSYAAAAAAPRAVAAADAAAAPQLQVVRLPKGAAALQVVRLPKGAAVAAPQPTRGELVLRAGNQGQTRNVDGVNYWLFYTFPLVGDRVKVTWSDGTSSLVCRVWLQAKLKYKDDPDRVLCNEKHGYEQRRCHPLICLHHLIKGCTNEKCEFGHIVAPLVTDERALQALMAAPAVQTVPNFLEFATIGGSSGGISNGLMQGGNMWATVAAMQTSKGAVALTQVAPPQARVSVTGWWRFCANGDACTHGKACRFGHSWSPSPIWDPDMPERKVFCTDLKAGRVDFRQLFVQMYLVLARNIELVEQILQKACPRGLKGVVMDEKLVEQLKNGEEVDVTRLFLLWNSMSSTARSQYAVEKLDMAETLREGVFALGTKQAEHHALAAAALVKECPTQKYFVQKYHRVNFLKENKAAIALYPEETAALSFAQAGERPCTSCTWTCNRGGHLPGGHLEGGHLMDDCAKGSRLTFASLFGDTFVEQDMELMTTLLNLRKLLYTGFCRNLLELLGLSNEVYTEQQESGWQTQVAKKATSEVSRFASDVEALNMKLQNIDAQLKEQHDILAKHDAALSTLEGDEGKKLKFMHFYLESRVNQIELENALGVRINKRKMHNEELEAMDKQKASLEERIAGCAPGSKGWQTACDKLEGLVHTTTFMDDEGVERTSTEFDAEQERRSETISVFNAEIFELQAELTRLTALMSSETDKVHTMMDQKELQDFLDKPKEDFQSFLKETTRLLARLTMSVKTNTVGPAREKIKGLKKERVSVAAQFEEKLGLFNEARAKQCDEDRMLREALLRNVKEDNPGMFQPAQQALDDALAALAAHQARDFLVEASEAREAALAAQKAVKEGSQEDKRALRKTFGKVNAAYAVANAALAACGAIEEALQQKVTEATAEIEQLLEAELAKERASDAKHELFVNQRDARLSLLNKSYKVVNLELNPAHTTEVRVHLAKFTYTMQRTQQTDMQSLTLDERVKFFTTLVELARERGVISVPWLDHMLEQVHFLIVEARGTNALCPVKHHGYAPIDMAATMADIKAQLRAQVTVAPVPVPAFTLQEAEFAPLNPSMMPASTPMPTSTPMPALNYAMVVQEGADAGVPAPVHVSAPVPAPAPAPKPAYINAGRKRGAAKKDRQEVKQEEIEHDKSVVFVGPGESEKTKAAKAAAVEAKAAAVKAAAVEAKVMASVAEMAAVRLADLKDAALLAKKELQAAGTPSDDVLEAAMEGALADATLALHELEMAQKMVGKSHTVITELAFVAKEAFWDLKQQMAAVATSKYIKLNVNYEVLPEMLLEEETAVAVKKTVFDAAVAELESAKTASELEAVVLKAQHKVKQAQGKLEAATRKFDKCMQQHKPANEAAVDAAAAELEGFQAALAAAMAATAAPAAVAAMAAVGAATVAVAVVQTQSDVDKETASAMRVAFEESPMCRMAPLLVGKLMQGLVPAMVEDESDVAFEDASSAAAEATTLSQVLSFGANKESAVFSLTEHKMVWHKMVCVKAVGLDSDSDSEEDEVKNVLRLGPLLEPICDAVNKLWKQTAKFSKVVEEDGKWFVQVDYKPMRTEMLKTLVRVTFEALFEAGMFISSADEDLSSAHVVPAAAAAADVAVVPVVPAAAAAADVAVVPVVSVVPAAAVVPAARFWTSDSDSDTDSDAEEDAPAAASRFWASDSDADEDAVVVAVTVSAVAPAAVAPAAAAAAAVSDSAAVKAVRAQVADVAVRVVTAKAELAAAQEAEAEAKAEVEAAVARHNAVDAQPNLTKAEKKKPLMAAKAEVDAATKVFKERTGDVRFAEGVLARVLAEQEELKTILHINKVFCVRVSVDDGNCKHKGKGKGKGKAEARAGVKSLMKGKKGDKDVVGFAGMQ
jgi:hypothetical protein